MSISLNNDLLDFAVNLTRDRDVCRCSTCGLVQYPTRTGNCRRCLHVLPHHMKCLIPEPLSTDEGEPAKLSNRQTVENIGQRIRQLRESRNTTHSQLQIGSKVSRSYLSRTENGQMTPSLGTLEKMADALKIGLNQFFSSELAGEGMLEDPFVGFFHVSFLCSVAAGKRR